MTFKELSYTLTDDRFAVLRVVKMILDQAILADQRLMLLAKFRCDLVWVTVTKHQWYRDSFFNLLSSLLISNKLDRFIRINRRIMIRVTEGALELTFDDKFLVFTLHHICFHTFATCCFITALQNYWFSILEIEEVIAGRALKVRTFDKFHI